MNGNETDRKCEAYNIRYGTEYTPETYEADRTKVPSVMAWDQGWDDGNRELMLTENASARMKAGLLELRELMRNSQNQTTSLMKMAMIVEISLENAEASHGCRNIGGFLAGRKIL
jgi:hypothetical protein